MLPLLLSAGLTLLASPARSEVDRQATALVKQLGDPSFRKREAAGRDLVALGGNAREALEAASNHPDPEIRRQCIRLLPMAQEEDIRSKLRAFRAADQSTVGQELPGWKRWSAMVGTDEKSLDFYARMLGENIDLFQFLEADPKKTSDAYLAHCEALSVVVKKAKMTIINKKRIFNNALLTVPTIYEFAALVFVNGDEKVLELLPKDAPRYESPKHESQFTDFLEQPYLKSFLSESPERAVFKRFFLAWLDEQLKSARVENPRFSASRFLYALVVLKAIRHNELKETIGAVEKALAGNNLDEYLRREAIGALGRIGNSTHIELLRPYLADKTELRDANFGKGPAVSTQIRDIALGAAIVLSSQQLSDYAFDGMKNIDPALDSIDVMTYRKYGFENDANRRKAYEKWNDYARKNGKPTIDTSAFKDEAKTEGSKK